MQNIINILGCKLGSFPFTYLGHPLSIIKLKIADFCPIMQRIERRISGCSTLISHDGRLQLIKSVFSPLRTFFMSCLALPLGGVEQLNKYLRHSLWRTYGFEDHGTTLIARDIVCKPKTHGSLGVVDILAHNKTLLIKNLHNFFNKCNLSRVKLIWETYYSDAPPHGKIEGSFWWKKHLKLIFCIRKLLSAMLG